MWRDSSYCNRMLPTWGPFPCVRTTSWPSVRRSARRALVSSIRRRWAAASPPPGGRSALPPMATTSFVTRRPPAEGPHYFDRSEEHTSELQSRFDLVCRLLLEKKKYVATLQLYELP